MSLLRQEAPLTGVPPQELPPEWVPHPTIPHVFSERYVLPDGAATTVHVYARKLGSIVARAVNLNPKQRPNKYCEMVRAKGGNVVAAMSGGFYDLQKRKPLGELWIAGEQQDYVPFGKRWDCIRGAVHLDGGQITIGSRNNPRLPRTPAGDLIQAGPLLVSDGVQMVDDRMSDPEGFKATRRQHDGDRAITEGRFPRGAIGYCANYMYGIVVDGRSDRNAGMTVGELSAYGVARGFDALLNMDGGGTAAIVAMDEECAYQVVNMPMNVGDSKRTYPPDPPGIRDGEVYPTPGGCRDTHTLVVFSDAVWL